MAPPVSPAKADIVPTPEIKTTQTPQKIPAAATTPSVPVVPKMSAAVDKVDHAVKSQPHREEEIRRAVTQWADAWSKRDATTYLSYYASDFAPPEGMKRAEWEAQRKSRLSKYHSIKLTLRNIKVSYSGGNTASVSFAQDFRADNHMEIRTKKELDLKNTQGRWLIVSEKNS